jgi:hypothetical protein
VGGIGAAAAGTGAPGAVAGFDGRKAFGAGGAAMNLLVPPGAVTFCPDVAGAGTAGTGDGGEGKGSADALALAKNATLTRPAIIPPANTR